MTVHGLCHLMGYDHIEDEDKKKMRAMEEKILSAIGMTRDGEMQTDVSDETLLEMARQAMLRSYSPYSGYPVGAALLCADGRVFQGCNIENASFGLTNCAERTAMFKAVSEGAREFTAIAIASRDAAPWPCGRVPTGTQRICTEYPRAGDVAGRHGKRDPAGTAAARLRPAAADDEGVNRSKYK